MLIYLASPYTHPDPSVRDQRAKEACRVACALIRKGFHVIAPIAFFHQVSQCGELPPVFEYWEELDKKLLSVCGELWIITMPGWVGSMGVAAEIKYAKELNIPICYVDPVTLLKDPL